MDPNRSLPENKNIRIVLLGPPGAGKGTQARLIARHFDIPQIATGDMLRTAVQSASPLGKKVKFLMSQGELVSDEIIIALVQDRISQPDCIQGFLLDGFPRTLPQAEALKDSLIYINYVIEIDVDDEEIVHRLSGRRFHAESGRTYHIDYHPPKIAGLDDITGGPLIQREDDQEETIRKRLTIYHNQTKPLIRYYKDWSKNSDSLAPHFIKIAGSGEVNDIQHKIVDLIQSDPENVI